MLEFASGTKVWLRSLNVKTARPSVKLEDKKLDPFKIREEVETYARRLELPLTMKIHSVFHVSMLEPYKEVTSG
jgi:hypothetical protein